MGTIVSKERDDAAAVLFNVATILEIAGEAPDRVSRYRRAARLMLDADTTAVEIGRLSLGRVLQDKIVARFRADTVIPRSTER